MRYHIVLFINIIIMTACIMGLYAQEESFLQELRPIVSVGSSSDTLFYTGVLGSISQSTTPNRGRAHVLGSFTLTNADYSRAAFDAVPEELENFAVSLSLVTVFQIWKSDKFLHHTTVTIGTQQGLSNSNLETEQLQWWYESNYYTGLAFVFPNNLTTAITYSLTTSPNVGLVGNELNFAISYTQNNTIGKWEPLLEIAVPLGNSEGILFQAGGNPSFKMFEDSNYPISISIPLRLGAGFLGYHIEDEDFTGFFSVGITSQLTPQTIAAAYGKWNIALGVELVGRGDELASADTPADNGGNFIVIGRLGLGFIY